MIHLRLFPRIDLGSMTGLMLAASAFALNTAVDVVLKLLSSGHPVYQLLAVNGVFALIPIFIAAMMTGGTSRIATTKPIKHFLRGLCGCASAFSAVYAYARIPLVDFYAIVFAGPLIVTALSAFVLKEKIDLARWLAIAVGFIGVLVVTNPIEAMAHHAAGDGTQIMLGRLAALVSVSCYAMAVIGVRKMRNGESNLTFSFYGYVSTLAVAWLLLGINGGPPMVALDYAHLALSGTLAGIGSICMMTAYHRTPVSLVAPFQYTQIVWGALFGYLLWQTVPNVNLIFGALIVAASGLFVIYRELRASPINP